MVFFSKLWPHSRMSHVLHSLIHGKHKIVLPEMTKHRVLKLSMLHHFVDLFQVCSSNGTGAKTGPVLGVTLFIQVYTEKI